MPVRLTTTSTAEINGYVTAVAAMPRLVHERVTCAVLRGGWWKGAAAKLDGPANGLEVNPRGQGPRGYGSAAHGLPACESRDAGRAPPCRF